MKTLTPQSQYQLLMLGADFVYEKQNVSETDMQTGIQTDG